MRRLADTSSNGIFRRDRLCLAVAIALAPVAGYAQQEALVSGELEVGVGYVDKDSWKFGEYNGLGDRGAFAIGNIGLRMRDRDSAKWWTLTGTNLGLTSRNLRFDMGTQGSYRFWAEYDQLEKRGSDTGRTLFNGAGSNNLTLPAGFVGILPTDTTVAARAAKVDPFLQNLDLKQERKNYIAGVSALLPQGWQASVNFRHEKKEGIKLQGGVFGSNGGNPRSSLIPEPVDYETNELEAKLEYATPKAQVRVTYNLSLFRNGNDALTWQNPYTSASATGTPWSAASAGWPTGVGQLALPPDNQAHHLSVNGGYNFSPTTRLGYSFALGRMTQNESFLPYAATPGIVITTPLPRSSLDGKANTTLANLNITSRVLPKLTLRGSYKYDERDDRTPQAQYLYIGGDSQSPQSGVATDRARTNLPLSHKQHLVKLDADYVLRPGTKLNAGYDYQQIHRDHEEVDKTKEHTVRVGVRSSIVENVTGAAKYSHSRRRADQYTDAPFEESFSPQYRATLAPGTVFDNHLLVRKYNFSNRDRDALKFNVTASPYQKVTLGLAAEYYDDDYKTDKNILLGRNDAKGTIYTLDAGFTPADKVTVFAYYTHDNYKSHQNGRSFTSTTKAAAAVDGPYPAGDWFVGVDNKADTFGIGFKVTEFQGRIDFGGDLIYTRSTGHVDPTATTLAALPLPDNKTRLTALQLFAKYQLQKNSWAKLTFLYQKYRESDWAWDNVRPTEMANVISTGQQPPNYSVTGVGVSYIYRFQ